MEQKDKNTKGQDVTYGDHPKMKGYIAQPNNVSDKVPGVIVVHEWWGHDAYCRKRADQLAGLGYVSLALDMFGDGKHTCHAKEAGEYAKQCTSNFEDAKGRFLKALETLKANPHCDNSKVAAIGYCFGGLIVLNMAREGLDLKGVASFHGALKGLTTAEKGKSKVKCLVCNGEADPLVKQEDIDAFKKEFDEAGIDYKFINYPGATHGFTNPEADAHGKENNLPLAYNQKADQESWNELVSFLKNVFA